MVSAHLQIEDPDRPQGRAVGIDLGTTNSLIAAELNGTVQVLPVHPDGALLCPSVVHYAADGSVLVGADALAKLPEHPTDTIRSAKRIIGKSRTDIAELQGYRFATTPGIARFEVAGGQAVTPIEVSGEILRHLRKRAQAYFSEPVSQAVVTVPAYFDEGQREATKTAVRLAGFELLRLLNEPTAAALAYGIDSQAQGNYAVYDLGGGTFDISILTVEDSVFHVKAVGGDAALGGDDFDRVIVEHFAPKLPPAEHARALLVAKAAKEALTTASEVRLTLAGTEQMLTRAKLEELIEPLLARTGAAVRKTLADSGFEAKDLNGTILVGGATRVPRVQSYVTDLMGRPPLSGIDPDLVVAIGAARQAAILSGESTSSEALLLDVIPLSLGLETMGGVVERIIPRNSTLPTTRIQIFTTFEDAQTGIVLHVVQGERELAADCRSLARFTLHGIPPQSAGLARVEVTFSVDSDGILLVSARELTSGVQQNIRVEPSHGLTDAEVEDMLLQSIEHTEEDLHSRVHAGLVVDAKRVLHDARKQLEENGDLLDEPARATLTTRLDRLEAAMTGETDLLKAALTEAEAAAAPFAEMLMDRAIARATVGHSVEEFEK